MVAFQGAINLLKVQQMKKPPGISKGKISESNIFCISRLSHIGGQDDMDNISQTTFSSVFSSMIFLNFDLNFNETCS